MSTSLRAQDRFGPYLIVRELGRGGMGVVFEAHDRHGDTVALKVLNGTGADHPDLVSRFEREAAIALALRHENVVAALDAGEINGLRYLATRYVEGADLARLVSERGAQSEAAVWSLAFDLISALDVVQRNGTIHRDVKPGNILVSTAGRALLTDFGLARPSDASLSRLTQSGTFLGTPSYAAPEQVMGEGDELDIRGDLYSAGAVLYYAATGRPPYEGRNRFEVCQKHLDAPIPDLRRDLPSASKDLAELVRTLLQKTPRARPSSPSAVLERWAAEFDDSSLDEGRRSLASAIDSLRRDEAGGKRRPISFAPEAPSEFAVSPFPGDDSFRAVPCGRSAHLIMETPVGTVEWQVHGGDRLDLAAAGSDVELLAHDAMRRRDAIVILTMTPKGPRLESTRRAPHVTIGGKDVAADGSLPTSGDLAFSNGGSFSYRCVPLPADPIALPALLIDVASPGGPRRVLLLPERFQLPGGAELLFASDSLWVRDRDADSFQPLYPDSTFLSGPLEVRVEA